MAKINTPKEGIDYAKVDKLTKEIAKRLNEIRELYLKEYPQGDYLLLTIFKNVFNLIILIGMKMCIYLLSIKKILEKRSESMAENKMKEVAKLLGVELEEKFRIEGFRSEYKLTNDGLMYWSYFDNKWLISIFLKELLTRELKIIKLPKPILNETERKYLSNVIKPFIKHIITIRKIEYNRYEFIEICIYRYDDGVSFETISFPYFNKGEMYKGMEINKEYTLKELGL